MESVLTVLMPKLSQILAIQFGSFNLPHGGAGGSTSLLSGKRFLAAQSCFVSLLIHGNTDIRLKLIGAFRKLRLLFTAVK